jgi:phage-related tail protein
VHLEKMKKDHDDLELQNQAGSKKIEAWSHKCDKLMKEQEALNNKYKILVKERETWKHACAEMAKGIAPVLDVIGTNSTEAGVEAPKIGLVEKSQKA